jgi:hypothetical protein
VSTSSEWAIFLKPVHRAHGIGGLNKKLGTFLVTFWVACTAGQWFTGLYGREFLQNENVRTFVDPFWAY